jgi:hypothetical protein
MIYLYFEDRNWVELSQDSIGAVSNFLVATLVMHWVSVQSLKVTTQN